MPYRDDFGRAINYLRVSVTDRCNLRCVYCMPPEGVAKRTHGEILRYEELALIIRAAAELGIAKVRLTGGEPLARVGLPDFVRMVAAIPGIDDLSLTTNGTLLARHARALVDAGLHRVNISLDTLRPDRFRRITRRGRLGDVWQGIEAAQAAGLEPIKLNMVVVRGLNDDEVVDFAFRSVTDGWHVRFIEWMPIGANLSWADDGVVPVSELRARIEAELGPLEPVHGPAGNGPARYYQPPARLGPAEGSVGFIGAMSDHFCATCNRLRLTADGRLRPCLMSDEEIDLRGPLRAATTASGGHTSPQMPGGDPAGLDAVRALLARAIHAKPQGHHLAAALSPQKRTMAQIGG